MNDDTSALGIKYTDWRDEQMRNPEFKAAYDALAPLTQPWYMALVEDCHAIITEAVFQSRWALVEGYHRLGERIIQDANWQRYAKGNKTSVQELARSLDVSERTVYYAIQFAEKYPSLDAVPEGKNISWTKLVNNYLPDGEHPRAEAWERHLDWIIRHARQLIASQDAPDVYREACIQLLERVGEL